jgi:hypothetical protein
MSIAIKYYYQCQCIGVVELLNSELLNVEQRNFQHFFLLFAFYNLRYHSYNTATVSILVACPH